MGRTEGKDKVVLIWLFSFFCAWADLPQRVLGRNSPKDCRCSGLNEIERSGQCVTVSVVETDVIAASGVRLKADGLTNDKCDRFRFCFPDCLRGLRAALSAMQLLMSEFMSESA